MINQIAEGVYEVENFLTDDEIYTLLLSATKDGFIESHPGNVVKDLLEESLIVVSTISDRIMSFFENAHSHTKITKIRRLTKGESMMLHKDSGYPQLKTKIVFGVAIYLNNDFDGGYLNYPELNISIKPKMGSMVIHDAKFLHQVLPVLNGSRYSLTTFINGDDSTKIKFY